jgi:three-Cys-motif partner protein
MNRFWGDESWRNAAYRKEIDLFGSHEEKTSNDEIAEAYRQRLKNGAGFKFVPKPMPMRNSSGAIIYYLFFASHNATAGRIVEEIFERYRQRGIR